MLQQINRLWNKAPVLSTNLFRNGEISKANNSKLKDSAILLFDTFVDTRRHHDSSTTALVKGVAATRSTSTSNRYSISSNRKNAKSESSHTDPQQHDKTKNRRRQRTTTTSSCSSLLKPHRAEPLSSQVYFVDSKTGLTTNDYFFEYQRNHGFCEHMIQTPEMVHLQNEISSYVQQYLFSFDSAAANDVAVRLCNHDVTVKIDMWATVQIGEAAYHADHVHENVFVSGVYYASMPEGSAPLVFHRPEYDEGCGDMVQNDTEETITVHPTEGQLIVFPPWLLHGVSPTGRKTNNSNPRVSFAFNVSGRTLMNPWNVTKE